MGADRLRFIDGIVCRLRNESTLSIQYITEVSVTSDDLLTLNNGSGRYQQPASSHRAVPG
jgi:hypothetical protein